MVEQVLWCQIQTRVAFTPRNISPLSSMNTGISIALRHTFDIEKALNLTEASSSVFSNRWIPMGSPLLALIRFSYRCHLLFLFAILQIALT